MNDLLFSFVPEDTVDHYYLSSDKFLAPLVVENLISPGQCMSKILKRKNEKTTLVL